MDAYLKLGLVSAMPALLAVLFYLLEKKTFFGKMNYIVRQVIIGILFGCLAILGTEWGVPLNGAQINCRDASVLTAGLLFGAPAGILAGVIGGVERWIAVLWGVGEFTRVACSVSTILAGIYAALLRKFMFEDKKPGWFLALAIGVVVEVFHLTMVFITNMETPIEAMAVVRACTVPMVLANGLSVMLGAMLLSFLGKERNLPRHARVRISQTIQRWLLVTVTFAFLLTSVFVFSLQNRIAGSQSDTQLDMAIEEVAADIRDTSDENLLSLARLIAAEIAKDDLKILAKRYGVDEINLVGRAGTIIDSTDPEYFGFSMTSGEQSREFLCLLDGTKEYAQEYGPISLDSTVMRKYVGVALPGGFIQVGYGTESLKKQIDDHIGGIAMNRHVGKTGFVLILDEAYRIVSAPAELPEGMVIADGENPVGNDTAALLAGKVPFDAARQKEGETFSMRVGGQEMICRFRFSEGYYIVSLLPRSEALQMRNIALYVNTFMEILVFAVMFGLIYLLIKRVVVNQIKNINGSLAKITGGDLSVVVDVRTNEEFASLSDDINSTVDTLKHYIDEASARIDQELQFAKDIQSSALPNVFPAFPKRHDFDIYALMAPAKEVGGDFYDFYLTHSDTLNFLVADVSGKGIPAAMFMMRAKTELKSLTEADLPLCDVFTRGNAALCEGNDAGMFVTAWQAGIDLQTGMLHYANAGHNPPLVKHGNGRFEYLKSRAGFVLAGMDGVSYRTQDLQLEPGDIVFLYTDGVTEATNADTELYGEERLSAAINAREFADMNELCRYVKADVDAFVGEAPQFDDITMVAFRYLGVPPLPSIHLDEAKIEDLNDVTAFVEGELEKLDCPMKTVFQINVAIDEIFSNIVHYGYSGKSGPVTVEMIVSDEPRSVSIRFTDEGIPYNPVVKEDPDVTLTADERKVGGLGIYMVKKTMDDMKYRYEEGKNILTITKNL